MARLKTFTSRGKGVNFDIFEDIDRVTEFRVDGIANLMIGPSVSKLVFYTTRSMEPADDKSGSEPIELRDINVKLSIPTRALLESCLSILTGVKATEQALMKAHKDEEDKIKEVLNTIHQVVDKKQQH